MKYTDRASVNYQKRSIDREDNRFSVEYNDTRRDRRVEEKYLRQRIRMVKNPLFNIMSKMDQYKIFKSFHSATNGKWTNEKIEYYYPDFEGTFDEFIEFLEHEKGEEKIINYRIRLRSSTINNLLD